MLEVYKSVLNQNGVLYCSAPITSGKRYIDWLDPFKLMAAEDPHGDTIASIIAQVSVEAIYSGALRTVSKASRSLNTNINTQFFTIFLAEMMP
jgi:hypothetical protein